jgi:hypothetical protein
MPVEPCRIMRLRLRMALVAIAVGVSTTPAMVQISSDEAAVLKQLGRDAALLWVVVEKCGDFFFVDKERGHARHDELVRQGMDRRDDYIFWAVLQKVSPLPLTILQQRGSIGPGVRRPRRM